MRGAPARVFMVALLPGCAGAGSCGGPLLPPIPSGFDEAARFDGAADVRLSASGLDRLEREAPALVSRFFPASCGGAADLACPTGFRDVGSGRPNPASCSAGGRCVERSSGRPGPLLGFPIPPTTQSGVRVCFDASRGSSPPACAAWLRVEGLTLAPRAPDVLRATVSAQLSTTPIPFRARILGRDVDCTASVDSWRDGPPLEDLEVDLRFSAYVPPGGGPPGGPRVLVEDVRAAIPPGDVDIGAPAGASVTDRLACAGFNAARGVLVGLLTRSLRDLVQAEVDEALGEPCTQSCSGGATCREGRCVDGQGVVIPAEPGVEGRVDLARLLAALGGRRQAPSADLALGLGAGLRADGTGLGAGLEGGLELAGPPAACVSRRASPRSRPSFAPTPPMPAADRVDLDFDGTAETPFMVALGLSRALADQLAWIFEQSGVVCGIVSSRDLPLLNTGAFSLLIPSLARLTGADRDPEAVFPARVRLRPQGPARLDLGQGETRIGSSGQPELVSPLFRLGLDDLRVELEAVVERRWVRLMTATLDLSLGLGAVIGARGDVELVVGDASSLARDIRVQPSELLLETPTELADAIPALLQLVLPELTRRLPSLEIPGPAALGGLDVQALGLRGAGGSPPTHAALFADLQLARGAPDRWLEPASTRAEVGAPTSKGELEVVLPEADERGRPLEYQLRRGRGAWSPFFPGGVVTWEAPALRVEGRHAVELRARRVGVPASLDPTPLRATVVSDFTPPRLAARVDHRRRGVVVRAWDAVDGGTLATFVEVDGTRRRVQLDDAGFAPVPELADPSARVEVIAADAAGQETTVRVRAGGPTRSGAAPGGPGCRTTGRGDALGALALAALVLGGARRRGHGRGESKPRANRAGI